MTDFVAGFVGAEPPAAPAPPAQPASAAPSVPVAAEAPAPAPVARFLTDKPRQTSVDLDWPLELDGVAYRTVTVRRMTVAEVGAFMDRVKDVGQSQVVRLPMFADEHGAPLPDALWDALDADDSDRLNQVASGFLPARFRGGTPAPSSTPASGGTTDAS